MIADLVFDIPLARSFSYVVPANMTVAVGQRVSAPLQGRARIGMVVALRDGEAGGLRAVERTVESAPGVRHPDEPRDGMPLARSPRAGSLVCTRRLVMTRRVR